MENKLKCDFHNHPLTHFYYPANATNNRYVVLCEDDKRDIETYINWCIDVRKLDVVGITDHDLIQSSLYAKEYVEKNNLPIQVVTGAEVEIWLSIAWGSDYTSVIRKERVHILVLGVTEIPKHNHKMDMGEFYTFINEVHELGGIAVMAHPCFSALSFYTVIDVLDGFEVLNRDMYDFEEGSQYCEMYNIKTREFKGSDYHYVEGKLHEYPVPVAHTYLTKYFIERLTKKTEKEK